MVGNQKKNLSEEVDLTLQLFARAYKDSKFESKESDEIVEILALATGLSNTKISQEMKSRITRMLSEEHDGLLSQFDSKKKQSRKTTVKSKNKQTDITDVVIEDN